MADNRLSIEIEVNNEQANSNLQETNRELTTLQTTAGEPIPDPTDAVEQGVAQLKQEINSLLLDSKDLQKEFTKDLRDNTVNVITGNQDLRQKIKDAITEVQQLQSELKSELKDPTNAAANGADTLKTKIEALKQKAQEIQTEFQQNLPDPTVTVNTAMDTLKGAIFALQQDAKSLRSELQQQLNDPTLATQQGGDQLKEKMVALLYEITKLQTELRNDFKDPTNPTAQGSDQLKTKLNALQQEYQQLSSQISKPLPDPTTSMQDGLSGLNTKLQNLSNAMNVFSQLQGYGQQVIQFATLLSNLGEKYQGLEAGIKNLQGEQMGAAVMEKLTSVAQQTNTSLEATVQMYTRMAQGSQETGRSSQDLINVTEALNNAIRISGTTGSEASGGLLQLSQAFNSGRLNGDEFRSVNENMPEVLRAVAKEMGVPYSALKDLSSQGQITSDVLISAITKMADVWKEKAANMPITFMQSMENIKTSWMDFLSKSEASQGALSAIGQGLKGISDAGMFVVDAISKLISGLSQISPTLPGITAGVAAVVGVFGGFNTSLGSLASSVASSVSSFTGLSGGLSGIGAAASAAWPKLLAMATGLPGYGAALAAAVVASEPLGKAIGALGAAAGAFVTGSWSLIPGIFKEYWNEGGKVVEKNVDLTKAFNENAAAVTAAKLAYTNQQTAYESITKKIDEQVTKLKAEGDGIKAVTENDKARVELLNTKNEKYTAMMAVLEKTAAADQKSATEYKKLSDEQSAAYVALKGKLDERVAAGVKVTEGEQKELDKAKEHAEKLSALATEQKNVAEKSAIAVEAYKKQALESEPLVSSLKKIHETAQSVTFQGLLEQVQYSQDKFKATDDEIKKGLQVTLKSLSTQELVQLKEAAGGVWNGAGEQGKSFAQVMDGVVSAAADKVGISLKGIGSSTKAGTDEGIQALQLVASSGQASSQEIVNAFTGLIKKAQTLEEIDALKAAFPDIASSAGASSTEIQQGQDQITLKFREIEDAANKLTFKQQKEEVNGFLQAFKDGKNNIDDLKQAQDYLIQNFDVLNKSDLNTLQSAIDSTSSKLRSANENAVSLIESVHKGYLKSIDATTELKKFEEDVAHEETMAKLNKLLKDGNLIAEARTGILSALKEEESRHEQAVVNINTAHDREITKLNATAEDLNATQEKRAAASTEIERQNGITNTLSSTYGSNGQAILTLKQNVEEMTTSMDAFTDSAIKAQGAYDIGWSGQGGPPGVMAEGGIIGASQSDLAALAQSGQLDVPHFAEGGVVDKPTVALIGEKGTEQVVPMAEGGEVKSSDDITLEIFSALKKKDVNSLLKISDSIVGNLLIDMNKKIDFQNLINEKSKKIIDENIDIIFDRKNPNSINELYGSIDRYQKSFGKEHAKQLQDKFYSAITIFIRKNMEIVLENMDLPVFKNFSKEDFFKDARQQYIQSIQLAEGGIITQDNLVNAAMQGQLDVPHFAEGGVVDKPTVALIGEKGTEQIIPMAEGGQTGNDFAKRPNGDTQIINGQAFRWLDGEWKTQEAYEEAMKNRKNFGELPKDKSVNEIEDDIKDAVDAKSEELLSKAESDIKKLPVDKQPPVNEKLNTAKAKLIEDRIKEAANAKDGEKLKESESDIKKLPADKQLPLEKKLDDERGKIVREIILARLNSIDNINNLKSYHEAVDYDILKTSIPWEIYRPIKTEIETTKRNDLSFANKIRSIAQSIYEEWKKTAKGGELWSFAAEMPQERLGQLYGSKIAEVYEEYLGLRHSGDVLEKLDLADIGKSGFLLKEALDLLNNNKFGYRLEYAQLIGQMRNKPAAFYKERLKPIISNADISFGEMGNQIDELDREFSDFNRYAQISFDSLAYKTEIVKSFKDNPTFLNRVDATSKKEFDAIQGDQLYKSSLHDVLRTPPFSELYTKSVADIVEGWEKLENPTRADQKRRRNIYSKNALRMKGGSGQNGNEMSRSGMGRMAEGGVIDDENIEKLPEEIDKSVETEKLPAVKHRLLTKKMAVGGVIDDENIEKLPHAAVGTVVNQPTVTTLGTKGAEAIIPLTRGPININKLPQYSGPTKALIGEAGAEVRMPLDAVPVDRNGWVDKSRLPAMASGGIAGSGSSSVSIDYNAMANAIKNAMSGMTLSVTISSNGLTQAVITDIKNSKRNYA